MRRLRSCACLLAAATTVSGCASFGAGRLYEDQLGYSRALSDSQKAQTLLNIVRIRYGDSPVFLNTTQVIAGYTLQRSFNGTLTLAPGASTPTMLAGTPGATFTQSPTFTFQPVTGEALAQSIIRPLSPAELLPLSLSGTPIDVLFRLAVQSVNGLQNAASLDAGNRGGSPGFYHLLINLRRLQIAGLLGARLAPAPQSTSGGGAGTGGGGDHPAPPPEQHLVLIIRDSQDAQLQSVVLATRRMLGLSRTAQEAEVIYGSGRAPAGKVAILTRPILGVLSQVGAEVQVPPEDIARGLTIATVNDSAIMTRPTVIIHSGQTAPKDVFSAAQYRRRWYWIDSDDFDSKVAFSILQMLVTLAATTPPSNTVVTIPAH
jgi:hypothetical protein